jgi:hypothetical protein
MTQNILSVLDTLPINAWAYPRILVGIPIERCLSYASLVFFNFLEIATQGPAFVDIKYGRIDVTRNLMATALLQSEYTHLLMLDVDHVHPTDIIQRLARWVLLYPNVQVVSGLNFRRGEPFDPVAGDQFYETGERKVLMEWDPGLIEMKEVGGASLLVAKEVFERIEPPWFFNDYSKVWQNDFPGEDIGFSHKCAEAGIKIYVDTTTSSPHCIENLVTEETFRAYLAAHPEKVRND